MCEGKNHKTFILLQPNWISSLLILIERTQSYEEDKALAVIYFYFSFSCLFFGLRKIFSCPPMCVEMCEHDNYIISLHGLIKTNFLDVCLSKLCSILFLNVPPLLPSSPLLEYMYTRENFYVLSPLTLKACTKIYQWPFPNSIYEDFLPHEPDKLWH